MSKAAYLSGKAINITTTTAPHAISYPITTYFGLQHGHAVSLTLGIFFVINYESNNLVDARGKEYLKNTMMDLYAMFGVHSPLECKHKWYEIMESIGLDSNIESLGLSSEDVINKIIDHVDLLRLSNHPVYVCKDIIKKCLLCSKS
jgi:alcohol dehydrogenase class IV